ncbi:MAG TPA: tripartite tricarboxylate transporter TctB family protein [Candidatus Acidoferrales bacterium]|nr:tripartite tricarboxylate transporter TctB family protein [Candidatus Acidoferrales bacterium]
MISAIRSTKDFWTGIIYVVFGVGAVVLARDYGMGTALKMGPGYFPTVLGGLLTVIGVISLIRSFIKEGTPISRFGLKGLVLVAGSTLAFGLLLRGAGLAVALPVLVLVSSYASAHFRWERSLALAAGLTVFCVLVFLKGLGVPLPVLGSWFGG